MTDHNNNCLIEFIHQYDDGFVITKRGLDATPLVVKKYGLAPNEVMAFSCYQRANRALTAFHFHPEFPVEGRPAYMRDHKEGHAVARSIGAEAAARRAQRRRRIEDRIAGLGRSLALQLQSAAVFLAAGGSMTR